MKKLFAIAIAIIIAGCEKPATIFSPPIEKETPVHEDAWVRVVNATTDLVIQHVRYNDLYAIYNGAKQLDHDYNTTIEPNGGVRYIKVPYENMGSYQLRFFVRDNFFCHTTVKYTTSEGIETTIIISGTTTIEVE